MACALVRRIVNLLSALVMIVYCDPHNDSLDVCALRRTKTTTCFFCIFVGRGMYRRSILGLQGDRRSMGKRATNINAKLRQSTEIYCILRPNPAQLLKLHIGATDVVGSDVCEQKN